LQTVFWSRVPSRDRSFLEILLGKDTGCYSKGLLNMADRQYPRRLSSLLTIMSPSLRNELTEGDHSSAGTPRRGGLRNFPRHDGGEGDDPITSIHDLFQWATPVQNESPLRRAGYVFTSIFALSHHP
jgi:hypothetical protein